MGNTLEKVRPFVDTRLPAKGAENRAWLKERSKWPTGFCNENGQPGQHEGTKPVDDLGRPKKTCPYFLSCPCACHKRVDEMFKMANMERREVPNPDYNPPRVEMIMPEVYVPDPLGAVDDAVVAELQEEGEVAAVAPWAPPAAPLAKRRTETGRAARGGLEAQVWDACTKLHEAAEESITPKRVGEWIAENYKIPTPSSGAINAVWDRWTKLGFCTQAKKPNRFVEFNGAGSWERLCRLKAEIKRTEKNQKSAARRGFR